MSNSHIEEIIGALWLIAAILCFGFGFVVSGWFLLAKALLDFVASWVYALKELKK